ncbi:response regulator [Streptomyces anthocyanicus]|uniref:response regulator n=1 Tax=Streptomyces anthocyanicus TaxID=68174 RepID=UPI00365A6C72
MPDQALPGPPLRVLVADDNPVVRAGLTALLEAHPDTVVVAAARDGEEALACALRHAPDVVLLDVRMPGVSGLDVVRYMRRVEQTQHIPVILLTGFGPDTELTATAFALGVADLLMKPVDPWALRTKVRYLYEAQQRHHNLERELRDLRALVKEHLPDTAPADPAAARIPEQPRRPSTRDGDRLEQGRTP